MAYFLEWRRLSPAERVPASSLATFKSDEPLAEVLVSADGALCCIKRDSRRITPIVWHEGLDGPCGLWPGLAGADQYAPFAFSGETLLVSTEREIFGLSSEGASRLVEASLPISEPSLSPDGRWLGWLEGDEEPLLRCQELEGGSSPRSLRGPKSCHRYAWRGPSEIVAAWFGPEGTTTPVLDLSSVTLMGEVNRRGTTHRLIGHMVGSKFGDVAISCSGWLGASDRSARLAEKRERGSLGSEPTAGVWLWAPDAAPLCVANEGSRGNPQVGPGAVAFLRSKVGYPESEVLMAGEGGGRILVSSDYIQHMAVDWAGRTLFVVCPAASRWILRQIGV